MQLYLSELVDHNLLDPNLSAKAGCYLQDQINNYAGQILSYLERSPKSAKYVLNVPSTELDYTAAVHCDKWLEDTARHMSLYAGSFGGPSVGAEVPGNVKTASYEDYEQVLQEFSTIKYKSFSGDMSGVIGEALFVLVLKKFFGLNDADFAHFGASKSTGVFPDFGIHAASDQLLQTFSHHQITGANLSETYLIPAEVKSMANPDLKIIKERLDKAVQQLRNFWNTRKLKSSDGCSIERGSSIIFIVLRNPFYSAYNGIIIWMS